MDAASNPIPASLARRLGDVRTIRLASGLILGLFLLTHFANIALGLVSAEAMDAAWPWLTGLWSNPVGNALLYAALAAHFGLALRALYRRRTLRMGGREAVQVAFGLGLPFLLVAHVVGTQVVPRLAGETADFAHVVHTLWSVSPGEGGRQLVALAVAWLHGCFGLWFWLRTKPWFPRAAPYLLAAAVLVPCAAALGFVAAGRELARVPPPPQRIPEMALEAGARARAALFAALGGAVAAVFLLRVGRALAGRSRRVRVRYADGRAVVVPAGFTVLEASRLARIPHASVCGGRGRCSTCRVRVLKGREDLPPQTEAERATLAHAGIRAGEGEAVRLACQLRPTSDLTVFPVYAQAPAGQGAPFRDAAAPGGVEREVAVLFCDLRGFTRRSEGALPFDTVHLLNRYFAVVGRAVEAGGGYLDKFIGDGALALFGLAAPADRACAQALSAAAAIARGLAALNADLRAEGGEPVRVAMGLHVGPCIVGEIGYGRTLSLTAVGDAINVASRLETAAKDLEVEAVVSAAVLAAAGREAAFERRTLAVRGRSGALDVVLVPDALALDARAEAG
ncbi:adenylate/guanylate cyclase domain-containing protein [Methylobacterium sp. NEAU 140]|uniref:adenylate/guanylate cyclase domain-containing protein n=1 Tax=Methylobacterium sp. NEAU 140 TaxID=3064945 RepID=UPI0027328B94|nr:adenylate/guanylate cyclase domain-containing protein [Methylobacterium sp. NEAU 140]MDP4023393.1 adenylate/guanylate cyclase domain-containing protein [Methylobacterium sp. NEAU 140]